MLHWIRHHLSARQIATLAFFAIVIFFETLFLLNIEKWAEHVGLDRLFLEGPVIDFLAHIPRLFASEYAIGAAFGATVVVFGGPIAQGVKWLRDRLSDLFSSKEKYNELVAFLTGFMLPACDARIAYHDAIVRHRYGDSAASELIKRGFRNDLNIVIQNFWSRYDRISSELNDSPALSFDKLVEVIDCFEKNEYRSFCEQIEPITSDMTREDCFRTSYADAQRLFAEWQQRHNAMIDAFASIKSNPSFGKLYRPLQESRWGPRA